LGAIRRLRTFSVRRSTPSHTFAPRMSSPPFSVRAPAEVGR
jgi:hypothetical protein